MAASNGASATDADTGVPPHDVPYFRALLSDQTARLDGLCSKWEAKAADAQAGGAMPEEAAGQVRAAVGKARLLTTKKGRFEQFSGLVDACEGKTGENKTTEQDLQGFWDMVSFQVEDVDRLFADLTELEANGWVARAAEKDDDDEENSRPRKKFKKNPAATKTAAAAAAKRTPNAALRQMMAAGRKEVAESAAMGPSPNGAAKKLLDATPLDSLLSVRTPSSALKPVNKSREKVFEAGFFHVRSPLRQGAAGDAAAAPGGTKLDFDSLADD